MRILAATLAVFAGFAGPLAAAQPGALDPNSLAARVALDAACAKAACRQDKEITLKLPSGGTASWLAKRSPYLDKDNVLVAFPGEMLVFHLETRDGKITPTFLRSEPAPPVGDAAKLSDGDRKVAAASDKDNEPAIAQALADWRADKNMRDRLQSAPPGTLYVYYRQVPNGPHMILETGHNLAGVLKLDATIARLTRQGGFHYEHSSTCGGVSGLGSLETWPYPLGPVMLSNLRLFPGNSPPAIRAYVIFDISRLTPPPNPVRKRLRKS